VRRRLAEIQAETVGADPAFGAHEVLQGDRATLEDVATALRTLTLAGTRLVVLRQADKLRDEVQKAMADLLAAVAPRTHFVAVAETVDMRRSLGAAFQARGRIERLGLGASRDARESRREIQDFVSNLAAERKLRLTPRGRDALADWVQGDAGRLDQEIEKLALRYADAEVGVEEVLDSVGGERARTAFALEGAIRDRRMDRAIAALRASFAAGERPEVLVGQLAGEIRALLRARGFLDAGMSEEEAKRAFGGGRGFFVVPRARNYKAAELRRCLLDLAAIDVAGKTGAGEVPARIEGMLVRLARNPAERA
jgi:DNA polymerase III delta subunit